MLTNKRNVKWLSELLKYFNIDDEYESSNAASQEELIIIS